MQNIIIMDVARIANKHWWDNDELELVDFYMEHMQATIMPRKAVEMSDVFIVTDENSFKILKCRVPNIPTDTVFPLYCLKATTDLIEEWQK